MPPAFWRRWWSRPVKLRVPSAFGRLLRGSGVPSLEGYPLEFDLGFSWLEVVIRNLVISVLVVVAACAPPDTRETAAAVFIEPEATETHFGRIQQLTFSGNNAESYFSQSGEQLIFQRQEQLGAGCDQQYIINIDGSGMRRVSNGLGRTTCGYFIQNDDGTSKLEGPSYYWFFVALMFITACAFVVFAKRYKEKTYTQD